MIALIPWGACEQHGPLLPKETDTIIATEVAKRIKERIENITLYPTISYGVSEEHAGFDGTGSIDPINGVHMMNDILKSIASNNKYDLVVIINAHGGNQDAASVVCNHLNYSTEGARFLSLHVFQEPVRNAAKEMFGAFSAHADSVESSVIAAITNLINEGVNHLEDYGDTKSLPHAMKLYPVNRISSCGIVSKTSEIVIDRQKGAAILEIATNSICDIINSYMDTIARMNTKYLL